MGMIVRPATEEEYLAIMMDDFYGEYMSLVMNSLVSGEEVVVIIRENAKGDPFLGTAIDVFFAVGEEMSKFWSKQGSGVGIYYYRSRTISSYVPPRWMDLILAGEPLLPITTKHGLRWEDDESRDTDESQ